MTGTVVKAKVGEFEEEVREGFSRITSKELTCVVYGVSGKKRLLVRFQDECNKDLTPNQFTIVIVEKIPAEEEPEEPTIHKIPDEKVTSEKGYYNGVYVIIQLNKEDSVDMKEENADMDPYNDEEEM